jgi:hypothetical protein
MRVSFPAMFFIFRIFKNLKNGGLKMDEKKKPDAYYKRTVHNSLVDEFRQNANSSKHIEPVGDELPDINNGKGESENSIEALISSQTPQDWLMFIEIRNYIMLFHICLPNNLLCYF